MYASWVIFVSKRQELLMMTWEKAWESLEVNVVQVGGGNWQEQYKGINQSVTGIIRISTPCDTCFGERVISGYAGVRRCWSLISIFFLQPMPYGVDYHVCPQTSNSLSVAFWVLKCDLLTNCNLHSIYKVSWQGKNCTVYISVRRQKIQHVYII